MKFSRRPLVSMSSLIFVVCLGVSSCSPPEPQEGARFEPTPNLEYNPRIISPIIIVPPLLACGKSVTVKGFVPGARIRIYADATLIGEDDGWDPEGQTFPVNPDLVKGQSVTATQDFEGRESGPSTPVLAPYTYNKPLKLYDRGLRRGSFFEWI